MAKGDGPLDEPFLTVFPAEPGKANGASVVIAPGGSNIMLMYGCEGIEIAERYNSWGVTAFVLTYRMAPKYDDAARALDGNRAIRLVRSRAKEWNLNPDLVGFAGFSAGSSLARITAAMATDGDPNAADPVERVSSRARYLAMVYSAGRPTPGEDLKKFPPVYLLAAAHDRGAANGSAQLFLDMNRAGTVVEMHMYQKGRHGFGSAYTSPEFGPWMDTLKHFLTVGGHLPASAKAPAAKTISSKTFPPGKAIQTINDGYGDFVLVPAGAFQMGDAAGVGEERERPVHTVELDAYYISKYEVTNGQWKAFRDDPGYNNPAFWPDGRVMPKDQIPYWTQENNHGGAIAGNENYPVLGVNWDAAVAYCNWLSAKTGKKYRLPTEAEWEKAARGTDLRIYPWGNDIDPSKTNYVQDAGFVTAKPVGSYPFPSPYGAYDMAGNVMEWCSDWYDKDYYKVSPKKNPKGPATGAYRVVRGGTFFMEAQDQRVTLRGAGWPSLQTHRMTSFRPVREP
jgi:formylglycine-generating enzyme required for sulfatase activity